MHTEFNSKATQSIKSAKLYLATFSIFIFLFISCNHPPHKKYNLEQLSLKEIESALISICRTNENYSTQDTLRSIPYEHIHLIVENWNNPIDIQLRKYLPTYKIELLLKSGERRMFRMNSSYIKESNDYAVKINNSDLGDELWKLSYKY